MSTATSEIIVEHPHPLVIRRVTRVSTAFGEIAFTEEGNGPAALFVHAAFMNGYQWRDITKIALDLLAHGETWTAHDQDVSFS